MTGDQPPQKLQLMFEMSTSRLYTRPQAARKLVDDACEFFLRNIFPLSFQSCFKRIKTVVFSAVNPLLQDGPYRVVHRVEIWRAGRPNILTPEIWEEALAQSQGGLGAMSGRPVLLKNPIPSLKVGTCPWVENTFKDDFLVVLCADFHVFLDKHQRSLSIRCYPAPYHDR